MTRLTRALGIGILASQIFPIQPTSIAQDIGTTAESSMVVPLYYRQQARDLLKADFSVTYGLLNEKAQAKESMGLAVYIHSEVRSSLPKKWKNDSTRVANTLIEVANRYEMDPLLLMGIIKRESSFNPDARGAAGEIGLMQMKPDTAKWLLSISGQESWSSKSINDRLSDPASNIAISTAYLAYLRDSFKGGRKTLFISAYNLGAGRVRSHLREGVRPRIYSDKVLAEYRKLTHSFLSEHRAEYSGGKRSVASLTSTFGLN